MAKDEATITISKSEFENLSRQAAGRKRVLIKPDDPNEKVLGYRLIGGVKRPVVVREKRDGVLMDGVRTVHGLIRWIPSKTLTIDESKRLAARANPKPAPAAQRKNVTDALAELES